MKEFITKRGGRHLFNEDFDHLQETVTALSGFFANSGLEFVITGCEKDGDYINGGYVFLDGKIRKVERTNVSELTAPYYILPRDVEYRRAYQKGNNDIVAIDYTTEIVGNTGEEQYPRIASDLSGVFTPNIYDFWDTYAVVDCGRPHQVPKIRFSGDIRTKVSTIYGTNADLEASVKNDGTLTLRMLDKNGTELSRIEVAPSGMPVSFYSGGTLSYQVGTTEGLIRIINATAHAINCDTVDATQYLLGGTDINNLYFGQSQYIDTGWLNIINTETNQPVDGFYARRILDTVYIQGTLPADFIAVDFSRRITLFGTYVTKYKLPTGLGETTSDYLPSELNFCHLHTIALVNYVRFNSGAIGGEHTMGCVVKINSNGEFCIYEGVSNGKEDGLYANSIPIFYEVSMGDGVNTRQTDNSLNVHEYANDMRPHVSWQYGVNTGLKASNIRYAYSQTVKYNPAPGFIVDNSTYSGYIIHNYAVKNKYVNDGTSEKNTQTWYFDIVKIEYRLKHRVYQYSNSWSLRSDSFVYDTDWAEYQRTQEADWVDYWYYTSSTEREWTTRLSGGGLYFKNPDDTKYCDVRVTFYNKSLGETHQAEFTILPYPECLNLDIHSGKISNTRGANNKWSMNAPAVYCYEKYYYERQAYMNYGYYLEEGSRTDGINVEIIEGGNYVQFADPAQTMYKSLQWTQAGLSATSKFTITVRATMYYKGMPDLMLTKTESIEIDPNYYNLTNDTIQ